MKNRVINELARLANGDQTEYKKALLEDLEGFNLPIEKRAKKALINILHDYSRFEISTIDHFFTRVVRALAWELKLPIKYEIDVDNEKAMTEAVSRLFDEVHTNAIVHAWLEDFAFSRLEDDRGWNVEYNLHELGMELFEEKFHQGFASHHISIEDLQDLVKQLHTIRDTFGSLLKDLANEAIDLINSNGLSVKDFSYGDRGAANTFFKIRYGDYRLTKRFINVAEGREDWYSQKSLKRDQIKTVAELGLDRITAEILTHHSSLYGNYVTAVQLLRNIFSYGLLEILNNKLAEYRADNNLMLLSDTGFLLREIIDKSDAPFIFEKVGSRYHHLVIDEFQDTSNYQWHNLLPMVLNTASDQHKLFIAGDVKQSIYRWRGGNMNLLIDGIKKDLQVFQEQITEKELDTNWRSARNIVEFNNSFFSAAKDIMSAHPELPEDRSLVAEAYKHLQQKAARAESGFVKAEFFEYWDQEQKHWTENAKREVISTISSCLSDGYTYRDMMILVDVGYQANELAEALAQNNIPVLTESSLLVTNSQQVQFLLSILRWFRDPENVVAKTNIVYTYLCLQGEEFDNNEILSDSRSEWNRFSAVLPKSFTNNYSQIASRPIYEAIEELIIAFGLQKDADGFLQRFQDICLEQSQRGNNSPGSFLEWWDEKLRRRDRNALRDLSIVTPSESDAVTIMTIHKAKGLEAPIVILPFAGDRFELKEKRNSTFWTDQLPEQFHQFGILPLNFDASLSESSFEQAYRQEYLEVMVEKLNVVYVAFTRARERLYIFSVKFDPKKLDAEINSLNKLIYSVLTHYSFDLKEYWDESTWLFQVGEGKPNQSKSQKGNASTLAQYGAYDYAEKIRIRSEAKRFFLLLDGEKSQRIKEGTKIHAALEKLESLDGKEKVISQLVSEGVINRSEGQDLLRQIDDLFNNTDIGKWFGPEWKVMNERAILSDGKIFRPDRVAFKGDLAVVIDYKLEKEESKHAKQITQYAELLARMGYKNIEKYLIYVSDAKVVQVK